MDTQAKNARAVFDRPRREDKRLGNAFVPSVGATVGRPLGKIPADVSTAAGAVERWGWSISHALGWGAVVLLALHLLRTRGP